MIHKEDQLLLATVEDKLCQSQEQYRITNTDFLDMRQRTVIDRYLKSRKGVRFGFYGGYEDAERVAAVFLPDYIEIEDGPSGLAAYFSGPGEEDGPLTLLRIKQNGYRELTHRDYLGSLTGLGLKREMIGDILVRKDGCDILIMKEISDFLLYHYEKAGRVYLGTELLPVRNIVIPEFKTELKRDTVASLRLDNLIASAFSLSRSKAASQITSGQVFVDGLQVVKADQNVKEGQKLVLRGGGKAVLREIAGTSRKDRTVIVLEKYL